MKKHLFWPLLVAGGLLMSACGSTASSTPPPKEFQGKTGAQIVSDVEAATLAQGSVRLTENITEGSATQTFTTTQVNDAGTTDGQIVYTIGTGPTAETSQIRLVNHVIYVNDTAGMIQSQFGKKAPTLANTWLSIPSTVADFERFSGVILLGQLTKTSFPLGPYTVGKVTTFHGHQALEIKGQPNTPSSSVTGTGTLYVSTTAPYLPLGVTFTANYATSTQTETATYTSVFSNWAEKTTAVKPSSSTPLQSTPLA